MGDRVVCMTTQIAVIEDVTKRTANSARGPFEIFEVQLMGNPHRARKDVWDIAMTLRGQSVFADTRTEQRGEWTNYFVDSIVPATQSVPVPMPVEQTTGYPLVGTAQPITAPTSGGTMNVHVTPQPTGYVVSDKDRIIWRQTATKVAADLRDPSDSDVTFWANVDMLIHFYETGLYPQP